MFLRKGVKLKKVNKGEYYTSVMKGKATLTPGENAEEDTVTIRWDGEKQPTTLKGQEINDDSTCQENKIHWDDPTPDKQFSRPTFQTSRSRHSPMGHF